MDNPNNAKVLEYTRDVIDFRGASYRMCCMGPTLVQENGVYNRKIIVDYAADQMAEQRQAEQGQGARE